MSRRRWDESNTTFCATIKYNPAGEQQWVTEYHGGRGTDDPRLSLLTTRVTPM